MADLAELNLKILSEQVETANRRLDDLEKKSEEAEKSVDKLGDRAKKTNEQSGKLSKTTERLTKKLKQVAAAAALAFSAQKVISTIREYEKGLVGVGKTADISGQALQFLGQDIVALSLVIPVATNELLEIAQAAGQLGVQGSANILKFTETIAKLGSASNLQGEEAATVLARILNVTGEDIQTVDRLASVIVKLGNTSAATEREIALVGTQVALNTAVFKVSATDAQALGAAYASLGVRAELAGSSTGRAFREINKAIRSGGEQLETLERITGMTADELRTLFEQDAVAVFQRFLAGLAASGDEAQEVLEAMNLSGTELGKTLPTLAKNFELVNDKLRQARKEYKENTALQKESQASSETLDAALIRYGNTIDAVILKLSALSAPMRDTVDFGSDLLVVMFELNKESDKIGDNAKEIGEALKNLIPFLGRINKEIDDAGTSLGSLFDLVGALEQKGLIKGGAQTVNGTGDLGTTVITADRITELDKLDSKTSDYLVLLGELQQQIELTNQQQFTGLGRTSEALDSVEDRYKRQVKFLKMQQAEAQELRSVLKTLQEQDVLDDAEVQQTIETFIKIQGVIRETQGQLDRARAKQQRELEAQRQQAQFIEQQADRVGNAFASAFESAIIEAQSLGDVLKTLVVEIQRVILEITLLNTVRTATAGIAQTIFGSILGGAAGVFGNAAAGGFGGGATPTVVSGAAGQVSRSTGIQSFGQLGDPFANGGVFKAGNVVPFANGGIVTQPTTFPMVNNRIGLMGEAGPEAIVPLAQTSGGRLGIEAIGTGSGGDQGQRASNVFITQNIKTQDSNSFDRSRKQTARRAKRAFS